MKSLCAKCGHPHALCNAPPPSQYNKTGVQEHLELHRINVRRRAARDLLRRSVSHRYMNTPTNGKNKARTEKSPSTSSNKLRQLWLLKVPQISIQSQCLTSPGVYNHKPKSITDTSPEPTESRNPSGTHTTSNATKRNALRSPI